ncbi:Importin subunit beta-3 like protein [Verticillium longisporum]|nr:Importin subunit beta-3 like protein [Verticillium longisporum]
MSADNNTRAQAEEHLQNNWTNTRPEILLMGLAEQVQAASETPVRSFAAVIFRRIASKTRKNERGDSVDMFISLATDQAAVIRQKLLETLAGDFDRSVRNKISDAVAEIARQYTENNDSWPELLGALFQLSMAPEAEKRETAFRGIREG